MTNIQAINLLKGLEQSLDDYCELNDEGKTAFRMAVTALEVFGISEQLPSAQPKQGHWIEHKWAEEVNEMLVSNYECSECHHWERYDSNFCPNCGAYMRKRRTEWRNTELNVL